MASSPSIHRSYIYAQKLNNNAALFVEVGKYDKAIVSLSKALKLWKPHIGDADSSEIGVCWCPHSTPYGCLRFYETNDHELDISSTNERLINSFRQVSPVSSNQHRSSDCDTGKTIRIRKNDNYYDDNDNDNAQQTDFGCGYMHRQLIRIPCKSLLMGHCMGSALTLIIIFNLGIAHHLNAITSTKRARTKIKKTLQLYQVAHNCLEKYRRDNHYCDAMADVRFKMILCNNLSHIHRFLGDVLKHRQCIEQLMSIIMYVVDINKARNVEYGSILLDGCIRNIAPLILTAQCADAA